MEFENNIKKGKIDNFYIFCGSDEKLIKDSIDKIVDKIVDKSLIDLNFIRLDGRKTDNDEIINACETLPFISERKVVEIFRANFLDDNFKNSENEKKIDFNKLSKYVKDIPEYCILIMYYVFKSDRDKPSKKVKALEKNCTLVKIDKIKGINLQFRVKEVFDKKGKKIDKAELSFFCSLVEGNMDIINNEVEKLCCYCMDRNITKEDILLLMSNKNENDIFNLVDYISQRNIKKSMDTVNELIYRGFEVSSILYMIERQFKLLFALRLGSENGKSVDVLAKEYRLHPFICEKMINQSKKFSKEALRRNLQLCINVEKQTKTSTTDNKIVLEFFIINSMIK